MMIMDISFVVRLLTLCPTTITRKLLVGVGHPQGWAKGDSPPGNVLKCFVQCETLRRRIIYA